jgi:NADPH:quinone reductase-like Zn-dependent oxidoreductase
MAHGDPRRVLRLNERPEPVPGAGEVLLDSEGFGLNYADTMAVRGLYRDAPSVPCVLGYETVGRVVAVGAGADPAFLGQRVVAITRFGGYAQRAVADQRACAVISSDMPLGVALALATQGCTAWYAARVLCPLRKGERVLVHSAAGGVGRMLVQLALDQGCEVYAIAGGPEKCAHLAAMGVQHVIDRKAGDPYAALRTALGGHKLDASFNAVGGSTFKKDMKLLAHGGRLVLYGGAQRGESGLFGTLGFVWRMGLVVPVFLMMGSRSLLGVNMLRIGESRADLLAECLKATVEACREGVLRPHVHGEYPAAELPSALLELASGRTMGKVAVRW